MSENIAPVEGRLPSLDGWRALAISIVMLSHFPYAKGFPLASWWGDVFQGNLGVRVFFVISGFLITHLLLMEADRRGRPSLRAFYTRRALRIFPVYFLYLAVVAVLTASGLYSETVSSWIGTLTFTRDVIGRGNSLTVHYWSLAVEEQFYLIWPVILVVLGLWRRPRLAIAVLLIPIGICPSIRAGLVQARWPDEWVARVLGPFSIARYADTLAIGCLGAFIYRAHRDRLQRFASGTVITCALVVFLIATAIESRLGAAVGALVAPVPAVATICAIWVTLDSRSGGLYRLLNTGPVVWLGILSYSLYVWQQLFLSHFAGPRLAALPVYDWRVWWLAALAAACVSYYAVERPILGVRDRLRAGLFAPAR